MLRKERLDLLFLLPLFLNPPILGGPSALVCSSVPFSPPSEVKCKRSLGSFCVLCCEKHGKRPPPLLRRRDLREERQAGRFLIDCPIDWSFELLFLGEVLLLLLLLLLLKTSDWLFLGGREAARKKIFDIFSFSMERHGTVHLPIAGRTYSCFEVRQFR